MNGIIYALKFPNGKVYIGQTINIRDRHQSSLKYKPKDGRNSRVYNAILKYGWNNIEKIILRSGIETKEELDDYECQYMDIYGSTNYECGYNLQYGKYGTHNISTKKSIGAKSKGRKHSEETKKNIGLKSKNIWSNPEYRKMMSDIKKGKKMAENSPNYKGEIIAINLYDENDVRYMRGSREQKENGFSLGRVSEVCRGIRETHKGFAFFRE